MPLQPVKTRAELDRATCSTLGCDHKAHAGKPLFLHPLCHPGRGINAEYVDGVLTLRCKPCNAFIVAVEVK